MTGSTSCPDQKKRMLSAAGALVFWLAVWQLAYSAVGKDYLLASPAQTLLGMLRLIKDPVFWRSLSATGLRVTGGFLSGMALAALLAFLSSAFPLFGALLAPLLGTVRATPVASFIILALVWMASGTLPVFIAFLMVLPLAYSNLRAGLKTLDRQLLEMARLFGFSRRKTLRLIYIPALMPYVTAACVSGLGFAWKSVIAAEVISHPALSIGKQIYGAKIYFEIDGLFAWTAAVVLISVALEKVAIKALKHLEHHLSRPNRATAQGGGRHA